MNDYNLEDPEEQTKYINVPAKQCDLGDFSGNTKFTKHQQKHVKSIQKRI